MKEINYLLSGETARDICTALGHNIDELDNWQICELVDYALDMFLCGDVINNR